MASFAESEGFEPSVPLQVHTLSRRAQSTALATLWAFWEGKSRVFLRFSQAWEGKNTAGTLIFTEGVDHHGFYVIESKLPLVFLLSLVVEFFC